MVEAGVVEEDDYMVVAFRDVETGDTIELQRGEVDGQDIALGMTGVCIVLNGGAATAYQAVAEWNIEAEGPRRAGGPVRPPQPTAPVQGLGSIGVSGLVRASKPPPPVGGHDRTSLTRCGSADRAATASASTMPPLEGIP